MQGRTFRCARKTDNRCRGVALAAPEKRTGLEAHPYTIEFE